MYVKDRILSLHYAIKKLAIGWVILGAVFLSLIGSFTASAISELLFNKNFASGVVNDFSLSEKIWFLCIIAPIFETLIFQYAIIETLREKRVRLRWAILASATVFALSHYYNPFYVVYAFFPGLMFGYLYFLPGKVIYGCLVVLTVHMLFNSIGVFLSTLG